MGRTEDEGIVLVDSGVETDSGVESGDESVVESAEEGIKVAARRKKE